MSGPKASDYYVSEDERRRRQAIQDALQLAAALEARYTLIKDKILEFDKHPPLRASQINTSISFTLTNRNDLTLIESYNAKLRETCFRLEENFATEAAQQAFENNLQQEMIQQSAEKFRNLLVVNQEIETAQDVLERHKKVLENTRLDNIRQKLQETVLRILSRLPGDISPEERKKIETVASLTLQSKNPSEMDAYESELRYKVQLAIEKSNKLSADAMKASELLAQLRGYRSAEIQTLVTELERVELKECPLSSSIPERVEAAYKRAKAESDRIYVESTIASTLEELGYGVEEDFSTLFISGGQIRLQKPAWGEYFVQLLVKPGENQINYNVVRLDDNSPATQNRQIRDQEMQAHWCSDFSKLNDTLEAKGIKHRLIRHVKAGELPVAVVRDTKTQKSQIQVSKANNKMKKTMN
jgi:hypothetical protein